MFGQQQQQQQGAVPQIFMNPWDPSQAPVMTLAPLANVANAMQAAYHQQMLLQQQASYCLCPTSEIGNKNLTLKKLG